jgi:hypothetical protein
MSLGTDLEASARRKGYRPRAGVVLKTLAAHDAIICAPCLLGHEEGEFIVDPRRLLNVERLAVQT